MSQAVRDRAAAGSPLAVLLEGIRKSYTMEGERRIHDAMWGKPADRVAAVAVETFEMFDDFGAATSPGAEPEVEGLELFDDFANEPAPAPAADEPLGTVEDDVLFSRLGGAENGGFA